MKDGISKRFGQFKEMINERKKNVINIKKVQWFEWKSI